MNVTLKIRHIYKVCDFLLSLSSEALDQITFTISSKFYTP